jgi:predicted RNA-binding Zn ribbon-like protein
VPEVVAAQRQVDGLILPRDVAGHPALELCNTRAGRETTSPREYLVSYRHLLALARDLGLVPAAVAGELDGAARTSPQAAGRVLADARRLREDVHGLLTGTGGDVDRLNATLRRAAAARRVTSLGGRVRWWTDDTGLAAPLTAFAWAAHRLLDGPSTGSVRACPGDGCGWLFLDPRGQRRWCLMAVCGNRSKARRHAARRRAG